MRIVSFGPVLQTPLLTAYLDEPDFCGHQSIRHSGARSYLVMTNIRKDASARTALLTAFLTPFRIGSLTVESVASVVCMLNGTAEFVDEPPAVVPVIHSQGPFVDDVETHRAMSRVCCVEPPTLVDTH